MAKNSLIINPVDKRKFSLEFSKESLSEFVFSLLATPRQEKRQYIGGFDLSLDETKIIFDKIIHKISTDHDIIHNEFLSQITFENDTVVTYNSYDQLFSMTEIRDDDVKRFTVTLSVVIPLNRSEGEKSYEKQILVLAFEAGKIGRVTTEIRSTEITWPEGYFKLIHQHLKKLSRSVDIHSNSVLDKLFFLYPIFLNDSNDYGGKVLSERYRSKYLLSVMVVLLLYSLFAVAFVATSGASSDSIVILNESSGLLERFDTRNIVEERGLEQVADAASQTNLVKRAYDYDVGSEPTSFFSALFSAFLQGSSLIAFIAAFVLAFGNFMYARVKSSARYGRVLFFQNEIPERPKGGVLAGAFVSLFLGFFWERLGNTLSENIVKPSEFFT